MKSIKTFSIFVLLTAFVVLQSCKKDKAATTPTSFTFNGVKYTTVKSTLNTHYFLFGSTYYSALIDSAVSDDKTKALVFVLGFNKSGRPTASSDYYVDVPSGLPASTPDLLTAQAYGLDFSTNEYTVYLTTNSGTDQTATVTDNGKITIDVPATYFEGTVYNSGGTITGAIANFLFSNTTFKEQ
ncbi:MAG TPA: hypothetical protein PK431_08815 [Chitinophagales bacterium]|nr:hypothetical protein [Chitinophagales bacterium]